MAINQTLAVRVFGGATTDQSARASSNPSDQVVGEVLPVATTSRMVKGPRRGAHFSYHLGVTELSAGASAITVWYSNLPYPDVTNDAHWVQDTTIGSLALTGVAQFFGNVGNVNAEWVRYKAVVAGDTASVFLYHRAEGSEN